MKKIVISLFVLCLIAYGIYDYVQSEAIKEAIKEKREKSICTSDEIMEYKNIIKLWCKNNLHKDISQDDIFQFIDNSDEKVSMIAVNVNTDDDFFNIVFGIERNSKKIIAKSRITTDWLQGSYYDLVVHPLQKSDNFDSKICTWDEREKHKVVVADFLNLPSYKLIEFQQDKKRSTDTLSVWYVKYPVNLTWNDKTLDMYIGFGIDRDSNIVTKITEREMLLSSCEESKLKNIY